MNQTRLYLHFSGFNSHLSTPIVSCSIQHHQRHIHQPNPTQSNAIPTNHTMQFSSAILLVVASSVAVASPIFDKRDGGAIATCETQVAADQVACIDACAKDAACIVAW